MEHFELKPRIPKRGPFVIELRNGNWVDVWFGRSQRLWWIQLKDPQGNQIGPGPRNTAIFCATREMAVHEALTLHSSSR